MKKILFILSCSIGLLSTINVAFAASSGCYRWHSCPSKTGSYICGDTGHCSECPDNQYCSGGAYHPSIQAAPTAPVLPEINPSPVSVPIAPSSPQPSPVPQQVPQLPVLVPPIVIFPTSNPVTVTTPVQTTPIQPPSLPLEDLKKPFVLFKQTRSLGCFAMNGLPDSACTPGGVFNVTAKDICRKGYSKSVRSVSTKIKNQAFNAYGIRFHPTGAYEVDHLIPLELGGSNDISNLWPEAANPQPGFREKDRVENYLHAQICKGSMSLDEAQREIVTDWLGVFQKINSAH